MAQWPFAPATLAEVVRLYGLRNWVEQGYKQVKDELGWADFQVRTDRAIRRHWTLVLCAFSCCWRAWFAARNAAWPPPPPDVDLPPEPTAPISTPAPPPAPTPALTPALTPATGWGEKTAAAARSAPAPASSPHATPTVAVMAGRPAPCPELALSLERALAHLARVVLSVPTTRTPAPPRPRRRRLLPASLPPLLTNYR